MPLDTDNHIGATDDTTSAKQGWPRTPDGTIDWEVVFEGPETGLIAMITAAGHHDTLYKVTEKIIRQLFTRKGDEAEVEAFLGELTRITDAAAQTGASVEGTRHSIIDLLRRIKTGRIAKAAEYVAEQKSKKDGIKRRRAQRRDDDRKLALKQRLLLMGGGGVAAAVLLIGVMTPLLMSGSSSQPTTPDAQRPAAPPSIVESRAPLETPPDPEPLASAPVEDTLEFTALGYPVSTLGADDIPKLAEYTVTLEPILFGRNVGAGGGSQSFILPVLSVRDPDVWSDVCSWSPVLTEAITGVMNHQIPQTGNLNSGHLVYAGELAMQMINQHLGGVVVDNVFLLHDIDQKLTSVRARCQLVSSG